MIALVQLLYSSIESSVRPIVEEYNYGEYKKKENHFSEIYKWFFENAGLSEHTSILDVLSTLRNVIIHDNGVTSVKTTNQVFPIIIMKCWAILL